MRKPLKAIDLTTGAEVPLGTVRSLRDDEPCVLEYLSRPNDDCRDGKVCVRIGEGDDSHTREFYARVVNVKVVEG